jgi:hypothetical protein
MTAPLCYRSTVFFHHIRHIFLSFPQRETRKEKLSACFKNVTLSFVFYRFKFAYLELR